MSLPAKFIVALFVVFLHYVEPIGIRAVNKHRYLLGWSRMDAVAIVLGMLGLAAGILGIDVLVSWSNSELLRQAFNHLFLVGLVSGWLAAFHKSLWIRPNVTQSLWMTAAAVIAYSFARSGTTLAHYAAWSCLILSPLILLVIIQMFSWQTWSFNPGPKPTASAETSQGAPVYFIIFDEWSLARSSVEGEFLPSLKNLRLFCDQSMVFRRALSPFNGTWESLPAILFQTDKTYTLINNEPSFRGPEGTVSTNKMDNLFRLSRKYNYKSYHLGWFHAYGQMLGDQVDYCRVHKSIIDLVGEQIEQTNIRQIYSEKPVECGLIGKVIYGILGVIPYLTDPLSSMIWHRLDPRIMCWQFYLMVQRFRKEMLEILAESPRRTFAFFHAPLPHAPFVTTPDGSYAGPTRDSLNPQGYLRNILYVDHVVGEIVGTLKAAGKYNDALLVITSDHSWRFEPDPDYRSLPHFDRSVPLLIKLPGQQVGQVIEQEISNNQLAPLIEAAFAGNNVNDALTQLLEQFPAENGKVLLSEL